MPQGTCLTALAASKVRLMYQEESLRILRLLFSRSHNRQNKICVIHISTSGLDLSTSLLGI